MQDLAGPVQAPRVHAPDLAHVLALERPALVDLAVRVPALAEHPRQVKRRVRNVPLQEAAAAARSIPRPKKAR
jgi:hypothetical protein